MPHASAVMLPGDDGRIFARAVPPDGGTQPVVLVAVAGDGIQLWHAEGGGFGPPEFVRRHAQVLEAGAVERLRRMTVVVVGCTILIDPDKVEWKNLKRAIHGIDNRVERANAAERELRTVIAEMK